MVGGRWTWTKQPTRLRRKRSFTQKNHQDDSTAISGSVCFIQHYTMSFPVENKVDFREKLSLQFVARRLNWLIDSMEIGGNEKSTVGHTILAYRRIGTRPASAGKKMRQTNYLSHMNINKRTTQ